MLCRGTGPDLHTVFYFLLLAASLGSLQSSGPQERGLMSVPLAPDPLSDPESSSPQFHLPAYKNTKSLLNPSLLGDSVQSFPVCYQCECSLFTSHHSYLLWGALFSKGCCIPTLSLWDTTCPGMFPPPSLAWGTGTTISWLILDQQMGNHPGSLTWFERFWAAADLPGYNLSYVLDYLESHLTCLNTLLDLLLPDSPHPRYPGHTRKQFLRRFLSRKLRLQIDFWRTFLDYLIF